MTLRAHWPPPIVAVNPDMVDEDQRQYGGPLIIEYCPDHLVDRSSGCPTIAIGHWPDRYDHSDADTPGDTESVNAADVNRVYEHALEPRLDRIVEAGIGVLRSPAEAGAAREALAVHEAWLSDLRALLRAAPGRDYHDSVLEFPEPPRADHGEAPSTRAWPGPFDVRALLGRCVPDDRRRLEQELAADRARFYATAMALAQEIDGSSGAELVIERAARACGLEIERAFARRFLNAMVGVARAAWAERPIRTTRGSSPRGAPSRDRRGDGGGEMER